MSTCTTARFHQLLFCLIVFEEFYIYNGQSYGINENKTKEISQLGNNGQFVILDMNKSWWDAVLYCQRNGMRIGEVNTMEEAHLVSQMMLKIRPVAMERAWIGGSTHLTGITDTDWRWLSSCTVIAGDNDLWLKKQSDMTDKIYFQSELSYGRCLLLDRHLDIKNQPYYIESSCDRRRGFICQTLNSTNNTKVNTTLIAKNYKCSLDFFNLSDSTQRSIDVTTMTSKKIIFQKMASPTTMISRYSTSVATTMFTIESPPTQMRKIKKINTTKHSLTTTTTIRAVATEATLEEYSDYEMWELGRKQMTTWKKQTKIENNIKISHVNQKKYEDLKKIKTQKSRKNLNTTYKPEVKRQTTKKPLKPSKPLKPLKLYYAFEGPMIGGLTATPLPKAEYDTEIKVVIAPRYHKYMSRKKYSELMSNTPPV